MIKKSSKIIAILIAFGFISNFIYAEAEKAVSDKQAAPKIESSIQKDSAIVSSPAVTVIPAQDFNANADKLVLYVGQTQYIPMSQPKSVRVGNPLIADIIDVANNQVAISAKSIGQTNFIWEDKFGGSSLLVKVLGEDLSPIKARLERVLSDLGFDKQIMLGVNEDEGKIFMTGNLKTEEDKQKLNLAIERMKDKIIDLVTVKEEKPLVEIEVQVFDMDETFTKNIGVSWPQSIQVSQGPAGGVTNDVWQRLFDFNNFTRSQLQVTFNFAIEERLGRVLAHPKVVTLSGQEAVINCGGEVPIFEQQGTGLSTTFKPYGVNLKIKPTVMDGNKIQTEVMAEVSSRDASAGSTASIAGTTTITYSVTGFSNRRIQTGLYMEENQTLVMGGLIYRNESKTTTRLPGLGKLPFFGQLFRSTRDDIPAGNGRELVIMITPRIIRQQEDMKKEQVVPISTPKVIPQERYRRVPVDLKDYIYDLKSRILNSAVYPEQAKDMGVEGIVKLKIHILKTGQLDNVVLETSSGNTILDNAALTLIKDLAPYKPFPKESEFEDIWVDLPLVYHK